MDLGSWKVDGRIPVVVGVTGHRDLVDSLSARREIDKVLEEIHSRFPASPLRGISALADGADRIFGRAILEAGYSLFAPLPLPRELYEMDFSSDSKKDFQDICENHLTHSYVLPFLDGSDATNTRDQGNLRNRQYAAVGVHIARKAHILIALWDGDQNNEAVGGTNWVVRYRRGPVAPHKYNFDDWRALFGERSLLDLPEFGLLYQIPVVRMSGSPIEDSTPRWLTQDWDVSCEELSETSDRRHRAVCELARLNDYNALVLKRGGVTLPEEDLGVSVDAHTRRLPAGVGKEEFTTEDHIDLEIDMQFRMADQLANVGVNRIRHFRTAVFLVASLVALAISTFYVWHGWLVLLVYLIITLSFLVLIRVQRRQEFSSSSEQLRALAEALRVQYYWHRMGIRETVAHHYLQRHQIGMGWVLTALLGASTSPDHDSSLATRSQLTEEWFGGQRSYYERRLKEYKHQTRLLNGSAIRLLWLGVAVAAVDFAALVSHLVRPESTGETVFTALMSFFALGAALVKGYLEMGSHEDDIKQYTRMGILFAAAELESAAVVESQEGNSVAIAKLLLDNTSIRVGKEALREHADWALVHESREPALLAG